MTAGGDAMMVVDVDYDSGFVPATPRRLFDTQGRFQRSGDPRSHVFDVTPNGDFVMIEAELEPARKSTSSSTGSRN